MASQMRVVRHVGKIESVNVHAIESDVRLCCMHVVEHRSRGTPPLRRGSLVD